MSGDSGYESACGCDTHVRDALAAKPPVSTLREALEKLANELRYESDSLTPWQEGGGPDPYEAGMDEASSRIRALLAAHPVEQADPFRNATPGLYRNDLGAELHVIKTAMPMNGWPTLAGDIAVAEDRDELFGTTTHLVTNNSLVRCGYVLITEAVQS